MDKKCRFQYLYDETADIELIICGRSSLSYPLHNHVSVFTIGIILSGSIILTTSSGSRICSDNQTFAILPYMPHSIQALSCYTMVSLCISKKVFKSGNPDNIKSSVVRLLKKALGTGQINNKQIEKLLNCLYSFGDSKPAGTSSYIDQLKEQLERFPEDKLGIDEMAQAAFTSKYHFIRSFKQEVGLTPHQFQLQNRIRKAKHLLKQADTLTEVALTTGFCDQSHFIKQFEKIVGLTPTAYKLSYGIVKYNSESQTSAGINLANR